MKWEDKVKLFGEPKYETLYRCVIVNYATKEERTVDLIAADESDHLWQTADDRSELNEWNWDVISWREIEERPTFCTENEKINTTKASTNKRKIAIIDGKKMEISEENYKELVRRIKKNKDSK